MDPRTVELLRALQGPEHDAVTLERISGMFNEERTSLKAEDDLGMLSHLGELMEGWAEGAEPELGSQALCMAARSAEDDLEQPDRAIKLLERVLDLEPTAEALEQLADLYMKRGGTNDAQQAADLYAALGDTLGGQEGKPYLQRALALVPAHEASIELSRLYAAEGKYRDALVCISPLAERGNADAVRMHEAYLINLEGAVPPKKSRRGESLPPPQVQRPARSGGTMVGFRLDQYHEALRQEEEQAAADPDADPKLDSAEEGRGPNEDSVVRALPMKQEAELQAAAPAAPVPAAPIAAAPIAATPLDGSKTLSGVGVPMIAPKRAAAPKPAPALKPPPKLAPAPVATAPAPVSASFSPPLANKLDASKTMMGIGMPGLLQASPKPLAAPAPVVEAPVETPEASLAAAPIAEASLADAPAAEAPAAEAPAAAQAPVAEEPVTEKMTGKKTMVGVGLPAGFLPSAAPAPVEEPAPVVRRSLPPPNPALVRASKPAPARASRPSLRTAGSSALTAPTAAAPPAFPMPSAFTPPAEVEPASVPEPFAAQPIATPAPLEPFTVSATPRADSGFPQKKSGPPIKMIAIAAAGLLALGGGVLAMMGGDSDDGSAASASAADGTRVSQQVAGAQPSTTAAAAAAPAAPAPVAAAPTPPPPVVAPTPPPAPEPVAEKKKAEPKKQQKGTIKVAAKEIKVKGGKISGTQIMVALEDVLPKIESCYADALEGKPKLAGKLTLGFSIQKTGKLAGARIAKSTVKNKPLETCAVEALEGQRFPKVKKAATVTMPIGLSPKG
jgi:tetratricopeptide (TPR) repeat protein